MSAIALTENSIIFYGNVLGADRATLTMAGTWDYGNGWSHLVGASIRRLLLVWLCCVGLVTLPNFTNGQGNSSKIAVPSYVYPCKPGSPGCAWDVFKTGASIVILNPNSGPGTATDTFVADFEDLLSTVKQNSSVTTVLGYVLTGYGNRDSSLVLADIATYYQIYPQIDGIFFDEGSTSCDTTILTKYKSYTDLVNSSNPMAQQFTALNWGTIGSECYLNGPFGQLMDTYVTFEGSYESYMALSDSDLKPGWMDDWVPGTWWHIVYATPTDGDVVRAAVSRAENLSAGYVYFTDAVLPNPYNVSASPTVWAAEV